MQTHHFTVTARSEIYFSDAPNHKIWFVDTAGNKRVASTALNWPRCMRISNDQSLLVVNDPPTTWVWSFRIERDGSLTNGRPFYRLETRGGSSKIDVGGM